MATSLKNGRHGWHEGRADRAEWRWIAIERLPRTCVGALKELGRPLELPTHWEGSPRGRVTQRRLLRAYRISRQQPYEAALMKHTTRHCGGHTRCATHSRCVSPWK
jgi:hypothetical protein